MPDMDGDMADMDDDMADMDDDEDEADVGWLQIIARLQASVGSIPITEAHVQDDGENLMPLSKPALGVRIAEAFGL